AKPAQPSPSETQEEIRKNYERQQALVQEQLAKLAQRERGTAAVTDMDRTTPAVIMEKWRTHEEQEKAKLLVGDAVWVIGSRLYNNFKLYKQKNNNLLKQF
ncbi:hypothetical protein AMECASPLE_012922, partial [Ameca splendens]